MAQAKRATDKKTQAMIRQAAESGTPIVMNSSSSQKKKTDKDPTSLQDKSEEYRAELNKLWAVLTDKGMSEEQRANILNNVSDDVLTDLRSMKNPYSKAIVGNGKYRVLCVSATNMTQKYATRFAATSFVAFIFEMMKEYEPKSAEAFPSENDPKFVEIYHRKIQEFEREKPVRDLKEMWEACNKKLDGFKLRVAASQAGKVLNDNNASAPPMSEAELREMNETIRDSFIIRTKMLKYRQFYLQKDITSLNDTLEALRRETSNLKIEVERNEREVEISEIKLIKRRLFEEGNTEEIVKIVEERHGSHKAKIAAILADPVRAGKGVKIEDMDLEMRAAHMRMIEEELSADDVTKEMSVSKFVNRVEISKTKVISSRKVRGDLDARFAKAQLRERDLAAQMKEYNDSLKDVRAQYDARFRSAAKAIRTQRGDKSLAATLEADLAGPHPLDEIEVERIDLTEAEYDALIEETKKELGIPKTKEESTADTIQLINEFLLMYLKYDPNNHVSCSYKPHYGPLDKRPKTGEDIQKLRESKLAEFSRSVVPPDDTFFRLRRYTENHYEELRQATDDIYAETSNFEFAAVPLETFEGDDPKEVDKRVGEYQRKYADEFETDILALQFNKWSLLDSWEENRKVYDFFTAKTEIIRRIIEKNEEDAKIGDKINKLRQEKKKRENTEKHGPDASGLEQVKKSTGPALEKYGAKANIMGQPVGKDHGISKKDEVEVGVTSLAPAIIGKRRVYTRPDNWKFHIPTEALKEGQMQMKSPGEFQKDLIEREAKGED
jgi:hypothetical protein